MGGRRCAGVGEALYFVDSRVGALRTLCYFGVRSSGFCGRLGGASSDSSLRGGLNSLSYERINLPGRQ